MSINKVDFEVTATREIGYHDATVTISLTSIMPNNKCVNALLNAIIESEIGMLNGMGKNKFGNSIFGAMKNPKMSKLAHIVEIVTKVLATEMARLNFDFPELNVTLSGTAEI